MTLEEGIKYKGNPFVIDNCNRETFPLFLKNRGAQVGAEVGVYKGEFTEKFCQVGIFMYAIDPWRAYAGAGRTQKVQDRQDFLYGHTQRVLAPYENKKIIRKSSMEALEDFKDESLDFVYIDGDHTFRYVAEDIVEWAKKVKKGGIVSGHDYFSTDPKAQNVICQVKPVVDAYVKCMGIENFWVFSSPNDGRHYGIQSWMWIKE